MKWKVNNESNLLSFLHYLILITYLNLKDYNNKIGYTLFIYETETENNI